MKAKDLDESERPRGRRGDVWLSGIGNPMFSLGGGSHISPF